MLIFTSDETFMLFMFSTLLQEIPPTPDGKVGKAGKGAEQFTRLDTTHEETSRAFRIGH